MIRAVRQEINFDAALSLAGSAFSLQLEPRETGCARLHREFEFIIGEARSRAEAAALSRGIGRRYNRKNPRDRIFRFRRPGATVQMDFANHKTGGSKTASRMLPVHHGSEQAIRDID